MFMVNTSRNSILVHYSGHKMWPLDPILKHFNPVSKFKPYFHIIQYDNILPSMFNFHSVASSLHSRKLSIGKNTLEFEPYVETSHL